MQANSRARKERGSQVWRSRLVVVAACASVAALAGCGSSSKSTSSAGAAANSTSSAGTSSGVDSKARALLPASIRSAGVLNDIINSPYAPMEFSRPGSSNFTGVDIDLAMAIAKELGLKLKFQNVQFPQVIPSVVTHRGDLAWTAVLDLAARHGQLDFIDYFKTGDQLYTSTANASSLKSAADLCGKAVVVPTGTDYAQVVHGLSKSLCQGKGAISVLQVASPAEQQLQIQEGRAAAAMIGVETILYLQKQQPGRWALIGKPYQPGYYGVVFAKNNAQLRSAVLAALKAAIADGTYQSVLKKWGESDAGVSQPTINAGR